MNLTKKQYKKICKYTAEIETDISADDKVSKILNRPQLYPMTTIWDKYAEYALNLAKNSNPTEIRENLKYLRYLMRQAKMEKQENPQKIEEVKTKIPEITGEDQVTSEEVEQEIIEKNSQKIEKGGICGIYGYFDTKKEIYIYIGKDSNIGINLRDMQHHASDSQQINRILRNDIEGRYEYHVIETIKNATVLALDTAERYYIKLFNTYHYENSEGMNFTKGGETTFGIKTEADINYNRVTRGINRRHTIYRGERDGKKQLHSVHTFGNDGDTFILTTNGGGDRGTQYAIRNEDNKKHKKVMQSMDLNSLLKRFDELGFKNSKLIDNLQ